MSMCIDLGALTVHLSFVVRIVTNNVTIGLPYLVTKETRSNLQLAAAGPLSKFRL